MKRIFLPLLLIVLVGCQMNTATVADISQDTGTYQLDIEPGTRLEYIYDMQGAEVTLRITTDEQDDGIILDWESMDPVPSKGRKIITSEALQAAEAEFPYFYGGEELLGEKTTLFWPRDRFADLAERDTTQFKPLGLDQRDPTEFVVSSRGVMSITVDSRIVEVPVVNVEERVLRSFNYIILDNPEYPLILKRTGDFNMEIRAVLLP